MNKRISTLAGTAILSVVLLLAIVLVKNDGAILDVPIAIGTFHISPRSQMAAVFGAGSGLVDYFTFEEGSGTTVSDSSGSGNSGTLTNGPAWTTGRIGTGGLSFDGVDDNVLIGNTSIISAGDATFCAWIYPKSSSPSRLTYLINNTQFYVSFDMLNDPSINAQFSSDSGNNHGTTASFSTETWHHICVARSGSVGNAYIDGALSGSANQNIGSPVATAWPVVIGQYSTIGGGNFYGVLDEVRIYNRALTSSEVSQIYTADLSNPVNDNMPPLFSNIRSSVSPTSATITWTTNEAADSQVEYGPDTNYSSLSPVPADSNLVTSHTITVTSLQSQKIYHYRVLSKDSAGNQGTSTSDQTFTTGAPAGTTINATSCSYADVRAAIDSAPDEGVLIIPAGTCAWTQQMVVDLTSPRRSLTIKGTGNIDGADSQKTIIQDGITIGDWAGMLLKITTSEGRSFRLTGITFRTSQSVINASGANTATINIMGDSKAFRIDHNDFDTVGGRAIYPLGYLFGVIDHNKFRSGVRNAINIFHNTWGGQTSGNGSWASPNSFGTEKAIYFEDNDVKSLLLSDAYDGARFVVRHNNIDTSITPVENHGVEGGSRSAYSMDVYYNTAKLADGGYFFYIRGGTAVFHNNTITAQPAPGYDPTAGIGHLINFRSWGEGTFGACDGTGAFDLNDGVIYDFGNHTGSMMVESLSANAKMTTTGKSWATDQWVGYSLRNVTRGWGSQISSNTSNTITTEPSVFVGRSGVDPHAWDTGDSYQILRVNSCLDQIGRGTGALLTGFSLDSTPKGWPNQAMEPVYSWANTVNGVSSNGMYSKAYVIKRGRDFVEGACRPGYTMYTYPHPLVQQQDGVPAISFPLNCPGSPPVTMYSLSVLKSGTGSGTVSGGSISCGPTCSSSSSSFPSGTQVTLIASPASGSTFTSWSGGGCSTTGVCQITVSSNTSVTATFTKGTDTPPSDNPPPVTPPTDDKTPPTVVITAPLVGATVSGSTVPISVTASDPVSPAGQLTSGMASVQLKLDGVNLGQELTTAPYSGTWNTLVFSNGSHTITAVAKDQAGNQKTSSPVTVTVANQAPTDSTPPTPPSSLTASSITQTSVVLSWTASTDNVGVTSYKVWRDSTQIGLPLTNTFLVTGLTPATTYTFTVQALDLAGNPSPKSLPTTITTAVNPVTTYTLTVVRSGNGTVSGNGLYCGSVCTISLVAGTPISLTAIASSNNTFTSWSGACSGSNTCQTTMNGNTTVYATFVPYTGPSNPSNPPVTPVFTPTVPQRPYIPPTTNPYSNPHTSATQSTNIRVITKTLSLGMTDPQVKLLQQILNKKGFRVATTGPGSPGKESTYFDKLTENAVKRFQCKKLLVCLGSPKVNGYGLVGPRTRGAMLVQ